MTTTPDTAAAAPRPATLAQALQGRTLAYLLSHGGDGPPHAAPVRVRLQTDGALRIDGLGRHTRANLARHGAAALLWPPAQAGGYSLMVDVQAQLDVDGARLAPTRAVLHRAAPLPEGAQQAGNCTSDCVELRF
ncbi:hypothetical protein GCM10022279_02660 [Comamonas faecalis]|uniref:Pyridoxamine 5'-phosphate oxidase putative domain-containing protein n=1 Tax=Comamonas faecalis TaxID=1387849 RepID=A0ABP7QK78_9BURK